MLSLSWYAYPSVMSLIWQLYKMNKLKKNQMMQNNIPVLDNGTS